MKIETRDFEWCNKKMYERLNPKANNRLNRDNCAVRVFVYLYWIEKWGRA